MCAELEKSILYKAPENVLFQKKKVAIIQSPSVRRMFDLYFTY